MVRTARETLRAGSSVSAAATAMISMPPKLKVTMRRAAATPDHPLGMNPPCPTRLDAPAAGAANTPQMSSTPTTRNTRTAATLNRANQNSNSPNRSTPSRLTAVRTTRKMSVSSHTGATGHIATRVDAAAIASAATTMTNSIHQTQPIANPAAGPMAREV